MAGTRRRRGADSATPSYPSMSGTRSHLATGIEPDMRDRLRGLNIADGTPACSWDNPVAPFRERGKRANRSQSNKHIERFRQGDGGTNRQFGGTGLGLAIAKEFVDMHHGGLGVRDSELGGACFQVTLPITRLSPTVPPSTISSAHQLDPAMIEGFIHELSQRSSVRDERILIDPLKSSTVVVVEDNPDMNRFITESLSDTYQVISAFDGQQGLEKVLESNPTLIITDIMMPKVSGVQMIAEIRKHPELADVPILLLSAKADEELKIQLLTEGAHDFVAKPFSEKDLLVRVRNLVKLKQTQDRYRAFSVRLEQIVQERTEQLEQSQDRLRVLATELNLAEQRERKRIAGELHDYLAQLLVVGRLNLGRMRRVGLSPQGDEMVKETEDVLNKALAYIRTLMAELSPPVLQEDGLPAALKWLGEQMQRNGLVVTVNVDDAVNCVLPDNSAVLLFQSVRELLMNALKHATPKKRRFGWKVPRRVSASMCATKAQDSILRRRVLWRPIPLCLPNLVSLVFVNG